MSHLSVSQCDTKMEIFCKSLDMWHRVIGYTHTDPHSFGMHTSALANDSHIFTAVVS